MSHPLIISLLPLSVPLISVTQKGRISIRLLLIFKVRSIFSPFIYFLEMLLKAVHFWWYTAEGLIVSDYMLIE